MPEYRLKEALYHNADKTQVVREGSRGAAFLIGQKGKVLSEARARELGLNLASLEEVQPVDRIAAEEDAIKAAEERGAVNEAAIRKQNLGRLEMEVTHDQKVAEPLPVEGDTPAAPEPAAEDEGDEPESEDAEDEGDEAKPAAKSAKTAAKKSAAKRR